MKRILIVAIALMLVGCLSGPAKFTIPDEPQFRDMHIYQMQDGICLDREGMNALQYNVKALKDYADKMRKTLEGLQK